MDTSQETDHASKGTTFWLQWAAIFISIFSLTVATVQGCTGINALNHSFKQVSDRQREEEVRNWQRIFVVQTVRNGKALTFEEILKDYKVEGTLNSELQIPASQLKDTALRRILLELQISNVIQPATVTGKEGTYYICQQTAYDPRFNRFTIEEDAGLLSMGLVQKNPGKYTVDTLFVDVTPRLPVTYDEFAKVINGLVGDKQLLARDGKLYTSTSIDADDGSAK